MSFRLLIVRTEPRDNNNNKKKIIFRFSPWLQIGLPDASLIFGFDSSREAEVQNLKIIVRWFLKVICLLLHTRHHFTHRYVPSLGKKHCSCWRITMRRADWKWKKLLLTFRVKTETPAGHPLLSWVETRQGIKATGLLSSISSLSSTNPELPTKHVGGQ